MRNASSPSFGISMLLLLSISMASLVPLVPLVGQDAPSTGAFLNGRVTGQDDSGNYIGVVSGAVIEFSSEDGQVAAQAITNEAGYYEVPNLKAGKYFYKVTADGYSPDDSGNGFELPSNTEGYNYPFILTRGNPQVRTGKLTGKVRLEENGNETPLANVRISARSPSSGVFETAFTGDDGTYSFDLAAGEWQVSALRMGQSAKVNPGTVTVGGRSDAQVDFVFRESEQIQLTFTRDVFAQVSVPRDAAEVAPEVRFINTETGVSQLGTVEKISQEELERRGIAEFFSETDPVVWFEAVPSEPLPAGTYLAEAEKPEMPVARSPEKPVSADKDTWYDLALVAPGGENGGGDSEPEPVIPGIRGRVTGQSELGDYLGVVSGAVLELTRDGDGATATVTTDETGYYELLDLGAGTWSLKATADPYAPIEEGYRFQLPELAGIQVLDLILSRGDFQPPRLATIKGQVFGKADGGNIPLSGAMVTLSPVGSRDLATLETDSEGKYEVEVEPGNWRASAVALGYEQVVYPDPILAEAKSESTVDFVLSKKEDGKITFSREVYAVVSVEITEGDTTPEPEIVFVSSASMQEVPGTTRRLRGEELAIIGGDGAAIAAGVNWFESVPSEPLPVGQWAVRGSHSDCMPAHTEAKPVGADASTYFDLSLKSFEVKPPPPEPDLPKLSRVIGRVSGQTSEGEYEGLLSRALVELRTPSGEVKRVFTDANGYYEIDGLGAGDYYYAVARSPYDPDDNGNGFHLPAENQGYIVDHILTRKVTGDGDLYGHVWLERGETKVPLRGGMVSAVHMETGEVRSTRSDLEGYYEFMLPAGQWKASVTTQQYGSKLHEPPVVIQRGSEERVDFVFSERMPPPVMVDPGLLSGNVWILEEDERYPEPGAMVVAMHEESGESRVAVTNEEGFYQFSLPARTWKVAAGVEDLGQQEADSPVILAAGGSEKRDFTFEVMSMPEPGEIMGQVLLDLAGETMPLPGVNVAVQNPDGELQMTQTDAEGMYSLVLDSDEWKIAASSMEHGSHLHPEAILLEPEAVERVDFLMAPPEPEISDVYVLVAVERTIAEPQIQPMIDLYALPEIGEGNVAAFDVAPEKIELVIEALGPNLEASPLFQELELTMEDVPEGDWLYFLGYPATDGVLPGRYMAVAALDDYVPVEMGPRSAHSGLLTLFDIALERIRPEILVKVQCTEGNPIPDARVTIVKQDSEQSVSDAPFVFTGEDGMTEQTLLEGGMGAYNLIVRAEGFQPLVQEIAASEAVTEVNLQMFGFPEVLVTARDSKDNPLSGVSFSIEKGPEKVAEDLSDATGIGSMILESGFGSYSLKASKSGYQSHLEPIVVEEELVSLEIDLFRTDEMRTMTFTGVVVEQPEGEDSVGPSGRRVADAMLAFQSSSGTALPPALAGRLSADRGGSFSFEKFPEGTYEVAAAAEGYQPYRGMVTVREGMEDAVIPLIPVNAEYNNWIRMILTDGDGWGNPTKSTQYHESGVREDPEDCRIDFALGLSGLRAESRNVTMGALGRSMGKEKISPWWDRGAEAHIWALMYHGQTQEAFSEIRRLIGDPYRNRELTEASRDTAFMMGVASAVLSEPWNAEPNPTVEEQLYRNALAVLQGAHRTAYEEGWNSVILQGKEFAQEERKAVTEIENNVGKMRNQIIAEADAEILRLRGELARVEDAMQKWRNFRANLLAQNNPNQWDNQIAGYEAEIARKNFQIGEIMGQAMQRQQMPKVACAQCREQGGFNPACEACQAMNQGNPGGGDQANLLIIARIRADIRGLENLRDDLRARKQGMLNQIAGEDKKYQDAMKILNGQKNTLDDQIEAQMAKKDSVPDVERMIADKAKEFDQKKKNFLEYNVYPLETRRQELLAAVNRKAELPSFDQGANLNPPAGGVALPPPLPGAGGGQPVSPPPLPGGGSRRVPQPPPLPR